MDVLIVEAIDREAAAWLASRHAVRYAPGLARNVRSLHGALGVVKAAIVPAGVAVDAALLRESPQLRVVGRVGAGADDIDVDACARAKVEVVRSLTSTAMAEAEFMLGAVLQMLRRLPLPGGDTYRPGRELGGATVGMIGLLPAARAMAQLLRVFGATVIGYDPTVHASDPVWARWQIGPRGLRDVFASADVLCVQMAYYHRYRGLLGERLLPHCRSNQVIVSISPSALFDEVALARALDHGVIGAAWLDHVEPGALDPGRPLADARNLFVTPRLAGATRESVQRAAWSVVRRIDALLAAAPGEVPEFSSTGPGAGLGLSAGHALP